MIVEHIKYGMVAVGYEHLEGVRDNVTSLSNLTAVGLERSKTISGGTKQTNTQILTAMAQGRRMQKKPLVEVSVLTFLFATEMKASQQDMNKSRIPLEYRDYCAHLLIPLNKCRGETFYLPWKCENERHAYEKCQYDE